MWTRRSRAAPTASAMAASPTRPSETAVAAGPGGLRGHYRGSYAALIGLGEPSSYRRGWRSKRLVETSPDRKVLRYSTFCRGASLETRSASHIDASRQGSAIKRRGKVKLSP